MKHIKALLLVFLSLFTAIFTVACKDDNDLEPFESKELVGIAIYQYSEENKNWDKIKKNPERINNYIETKDGTLFYGEEPEMLFYVYSTKTLSENSVNEDFISNTTKSPVTFDNKTLNIKLERFKESTSILIYFIYKLESGKFTLTYNSSKDNISENETSIILETENNYFTTINLTLCTNLSSKNEY